MSIDVKFASIRDKILAHRYFASFEIEIIFSRWRLSFRDGDFLRFNLKISSRPLSYWLYKIGTFPYRGKGGGQKFSEKKIDFLLLKTYFYTVFGLLRLKKKF